MSSCKAERIGAAIDWSRLASAHMASDSLAGCADCVRMGGKLLRHLVWAVDVHAPAPGVEPTVNKPTNNTGVFSKLCFGVLGKLCLNCSIHF